MNSPMDVQPTRGSRRSGDLKRWQIAALLEGCTLAALLFVAVPAKHLAGMPIVVKVLGPVHGIVFLYYAWVLANLWFEYPWRAVELARLLAGALVPFGNLGNHRMVRRRVMADSAAC